MAALYNEIDPFAADWLTGLVRDRKIAGGRVDRRSIRDLKPADVAPMAQVHLFAGIGGWSYSLRKAGWPDDCEVWTGSCPCQPFSTSGRKRGFDDDRHLWPDFFRLIRERMPPVVLGEQVASPDGLEWLDLVSSDLEGAGYSFGAVDLCAAGFGAPHLRQRLFFVALSDGKRLEGVRAHLRRRRSRQHLPEARGGGPAGGVADADGGGLGAGGVREGGADRQGRSGRAATDDGEDGELAESARRGRREGDALGRRGGDGEEPDDRRGRSGGGGEDGELADPECSRCGALRPRESCGCGRSVEPDRRGEDGELGDALRSGGGRDGRGVLAEEGRLGVVDRGEPDVALLAGVPGELGDADDARPPIGPWCTDGRGAVWLEGPTPAEAGAVGGPWAAARWHACRDAAGSVILRPAQPGVQPLVNGISRGSGRVGLIRGAGNAIVPEVAAGFIGAVVDYILEGGS